MDPQQGANSLHACLEHGLIPPLYVRAVSGNGAVMAVRYAYTPDAERMEATVLRFSRKHVQPGRGLWENTTA